MKPILSIVAAALLTAQLAQAQTGQTFDEQTVLAVQTYISVAEVKCMVALTPAQEQAYASCCAAFHKVVRHAVFVEKDAAATSLMLIEARQALADTLMLMLTEEQRVTYIRNAESGSVKLKTEEKMAAMREMGEFSQEELGKFYREIYDYFMLERVVHTLQKHNIEAAGYKQMPKKPESLSTANKLERLKISGALTNEHKYKW
ncbi:MAG: hypothetical protein LBF67_08770 [Prevotellaceae bacterium]|jgi:hypothetical protein|nr:hypothetical protein [Prevotellaceae bacterium]